MDGLLITDEEPLGKGCWTGSWVFDILLYGASIIKHKKTVKKLQYENTFTQ